MDNKKLKKMATIARRDILEMTSRAGSGHPGGSLSSADIIVCLYSSVMRHDPKKPDWPQRDRFILSKGHGCPALYSVLARSGYFPISELNALRQLGSILQGHPEYRACPGIEASTGPLGQGLSFANGVAISAKLDKSPFRTYVLMGDGELQEGQVWEAAMTSAHYKLDNLTAIVDNNRLQIDGFNDDVKKVDPIRDKFISFGWNVIEVDGHDFDALHEAFKSSAMPDGKPTVLIARTIKGKGVCCMENKAEWHGKACTGSQLTECLAELEYDD